MLGVKPTLGRGFLPGEDVAGREHVVVISDDLWRRNFGADPSVVNQTIPLNGQKYTVVGVMPRFIENMLFGVTPTDPLTFVAIVGLLGLVALLACLIPAQRAMRVDPIVVLRHQ